MANRVPTPSLSAPNPREQGENRATSPNQQRVMTLLPRQTRGSEPSHSHRRLGGRRQIQGGREEEEEGRKRGKYVFIKNRPDIKKGGQKNKEKRGTIKKEDTNE